MKIPDHQNFLQMSIHALSPPRDVNMDQLQLPGRSSLLAPKIGDIRAPGLIGGGRIKPPTRDILLHRQVISAVCCHLVLVLLTLRPSVFVNRTQQGPRLCENAGCKTSRKNSASSEAHRAEIGIRGRFFVPPVSQNFRVFTQPRPIAIPFARRCQGIIWLPKLSHVASKQVLYASMQASSSDGITPDGRTCQSK